jgi:hypothetical protein
MHERCGFAPGDKSPSGNKNLEKPRDIHICGGCGTTGDLVECGGIYNCPNPFCLATGAWNLRLERGYQDEEGGQTDDQLQRMLNDLMEEISHLNASLKILDGCRKRIRDRMDS